MLLIKQDTDTTEITTIDETGWGNNIAVVIFDNLNAANYTITIKMAQVTDTCSIMAFGYTK